MFLFKLDGERYELKKVIMTANAGWGRDKKISQVDIKSKLLNLYTEYNLFVKQPKL